MPDEARPPKTLGEMLKANSCFVVSDEHRNFLYQTPDGDLAVIEDIPWDGRRVVAYKIDRTEGSSSQLTLLTLDIEDIFDFVPVYSFSRRCLYSDLVEAAQSAERD